MNPNKSEQIDLYKTMVKIRAFEEAVLKVYTDGEVPGAGHLYIGEEAVAAGVCACLTEKDQICSTYRGHGHCIAKGGEMGPMMAEVFGKETGYCGGKGGSLHVSSRDIGMLGANGIVGAGSPIAVGAAFAQKYLETSDVTVVFFGDGASNRGTQHEAMNMASLWNLPVVFVVENNRIGFYTEQKKHQNIVDISVRASAYGFCGVTADGNDVIEVYKSAKAAVEKCRKGEGPVLLELKTWRHMGHYIGDSELYKDPEEQKYWLTHRDPIKNFGRKLIEDGIISDDAELNTLKEDVQSQVDDALEFARKSPFPKPEHITEGAYCVKES